MKSTTKLVFSTLFMALLVTSVLASLNSVTAQETTPKYGGTFVATYNHEHKSLNPMFRWDDQALRVAQIGFYSSLVGIDYMFGTGEVYPMLAKSWEVSPDAKVYTFSLYENITWHDGVKFTSADVKWTIEEIIDKKGASYAYFEDVNKIETPDDYTVKITLNNPNAAWLVLLGGYYAPVILPKHLYEGTDWSTNPYNEKPVGTGPFKVVEWVRGSHLTLEAYDDYHLGRPYLDRIIIRAPIPYPTAVGMLKAGEIATILSNPPPSEALDMEKNAKLDVFWSNHWVMNHWVFNLRREPFDDLRVRQAIVHSLDIPDITARLTLGTSMSSPGYWFQDNWAYNPDATQLEYDPEKAEELLDEAGLPRDPVTGIRFKVELGTWTTPPGPDHAILVKEYLRHVGIEATVVVLTWPEYAAKVVERLDFDIANFGGIAGPDPVEFEKFVTSTGYRNTAGFNSPRIDELMLLGRSNFDEEIRADSYREVQQILADKVNRITIYEHLVPTVSSSAFAGTAYDMSTLGRGYQLYNWAATYLKLGHDISPMDARDAIADAEQKIGELEEEEYDVSISLSRLSDAESALLAGDYTNAKEYSLQAPALAIAPKGETGEAGETGDESVTEPPYQLWTGILVAILIAIVVGVYLFQRKS